MRKKILHLALGAFFCQLAIMPVFAVRAYRGPVTVTQPDGNQITIHVNGDEFHHYQTTEDGYLVKQSSNGYYKYATINTNGDITESEFNVNNINKRNAREVRFLESVSLANQSAGLRSFVSKQTNLMRAKSTNTGPQRAYPLNGSPKALVILANFKDKAFSVSSPQASYQNLTTQSGYSANGGTGSAKDYFMSSTYGKFAPNFIVVGPVTLPQNLSYYGTNGTDGYDVYPAQMIVDACAAADAAGLDFTQFDTDNDGSVDNVFVYYAGYNEAEGAAANTIWPHRWSISDAGITTGITFDGKKINDYSCTSELKGTSGTNMCGIGTFCHEFGHVLGLPDFYDTSGTQSNTLNEWDIMDYGAYSNNGCTPPSYSAYERFFLGYLTPVQVSTPSDLTLLPMYQGTTQPANTDNQAYLFSATTHNLNGAAPSPTEFFMVEYRKQTSWDTYLPSEGMCIWHIDYNQAQWDANTPNNYTGSTQTSSSHMRVYLQPLSGSSTTPGTAFTTGSFTPTTWSGTNINRAITSITKTTDNVTFKLMGGNQGPAIASSGTVSAFSAVVGTPSASQNLTVSGTALTSNVNVSLADNTNFDIKLSTESSWSKSLSIAPTSGSISSVINIRYNPTIAGSQSTTLSLASTGATTINVGLSGIATAPVDPNAPTIIIGKIESTLQFAKTQTNQSKAKTLNIKTTDLNGDLSVSVTGANAGLFTVSTASVAKDNANNGINITITYKPTSTGVHTATLTISGGGLTADKVINLSGEGI